jgi:hypothetical protein
MTLPPPALRSQRTGTFRTRAYVPRMARNTRHLVQTDPALAEVVADLIRKVAPAAEQAVETHLAPVVRDAIAAWPVRTGLSRSRLALEMASDGRTFVASVVNDSDYAAYIQGGEVVRRLIFDPGEKAAAAMAREIVDEVAR